MDADLKTLELAQDAPQRSMQRLVRHLDSFSGIGGFALAAQWVGGIETVAFCEIDPWARRVLTKNFPTVPIHEDVKTLNPSNYVADAETLLSELGGAADEARLRVAEWEANQPSMVGVAHGIPHWVDRARGTGNAIVPQVAFEILRAMMAVDCMSND